MPRRRTGEIEALIGGKGSGKTFQAVKRAKARKRVLVWDSVGEWTESRLLPGAAHFGSLKELRAHLASGGRMFPKTVILAHSQEFLPFLGFAFRWAQLTRKEGKPLVVLEELSRYVNSSKKPAQFLDVVERSRHGGLDLLFISPMCYGVPSYAREQVDAWHIARVTSFGELKKFRNEYGNDVAEKLQSLKPHTFLTLSK